jgi:predicted phosphodiesterase
MRILCIGDVHGRPRWKQILNEVGQIDKVVFIGDYFDSFDIDGVRQIQNFQDIMQAKQDEPDKFVCCIGNHDFHYGPCAKIHDDIYSGYQKKFAPMISAVLEQHKNKLQMCYVYDKFIFTHAGITKTWLLSTVGLEEGVNLNMKGEILQDWINDVYKFTPRWFLFNPLHIMRPDPYGNHPSQSPIWVRPESLAKDALEGVHVVGHTQVDHLKITPNIIQIDNPSDNTYLVIEDGIPTVHQLKH